MGNQQKIESTISQFIDKPPEAMYDVGVGPKSEYIVLGNLYPEMKIIGLEPCHVRFRKLVPHFPGLLLPYAAWNESARLNLHRKTEKAIRGDAPTCFGYKNLTKKEVVTAKTLDWIDEQMGCLDRILLWMDIEGAELKALQGATKMLEEHRVKWLNLEVRPNPARDVIPTELDITEFLAHYGYKPVHRYAPGARRKHFDVIYILAG